MPPKAINPQKLTQISSLKDLTSQLSDKYEKAQKSGQTFRRFTSDFEIVSGIVEFLEKMDSALYSVDEIEDLTGELDGLVNSASHLQYTALPSNGFTRSYDEIFSAFESRGQKIVTRGLLQWQSQIQDVNSKNQQVIEELDAFSKSAQNTLDKIKSTEAEVQALLGSATSATQEVALARFSTKFEERAKKHSTESVIWLLGAMAALGVLIWLAMNKFNTAGDLSKTNLLIAYIGKRAIVFSAGFIAISFCIKNYKVNKHNELSNNQRQLALDTFQAFIASAKDDAQTKSAVLLEVTRTIFAPQASGYAMGDSELEGPSKIIEIIKNIPGGK